MQDGDLDPRLRGKTFVCGVGVQKAGTTWLHDYLAGVPGIYMSGRKELHYFDNRLTSRTTRIESSLIKQLKRQLEGFGETGPYHYSERFEECMDLLRMHYDDQGYAGYFARRVGDNGLFGEITPSYCLIGADGFRYMRSLFPRIKVIYLLRDPVDRHYSLMRMSEEGRGEPGFATRNFLSHLDRKFGRQMADYGNHIEALESVFSDDELFIGFYETLFTEREIRRLCDFLGVGFVPAPYDTRLNTSTTSSRLDAGLINAAIEILRPTYDFCRNRFSELPDSWHRPA